VPPRQILNLRYPVMAPVTHARERISYPVGCQVPSMGISNLCAQLVQSGPRPARLYHSSTAGVEGAMPRGAPVITATRPRKSISGLCCSTEPEDPVCHSCHWPTTDFLSRTAGAQGSCQAPELPLSRAASYRVTDLGAAYVLEALTPALKYLPSATPETTEEARESPRLAGLLVVRAQVEKPPHIAVPVQLPTHS
jgi:hypothetical protein